MNPKDLELIEKFLTDDLTDSEQSEFQERLNDKSFVAELNVHKHALHFLNLSEERQAREFLMARKSEKPLKKKTSRIKIILITLLMLAGAYFIFTYITDTQENQYEAAFATYLTPYPAATVKRGNETPVTETDAFEMVMQSYIDEDYETTVKLINDLQNQNNKEDLILYEIVSLLQLDRTEEARALIQTIDTSNQKNIRQNGDWYLAMSYLKDEQLENFNSTINKILNDQSHLFYKKAQSIKDELSSKF